MKNNMSVGILSHRAPKTLINTLLSYKESGFINKTNDIFCVLQNSEKQKEEIAVCEQFNIRSVVMKDNKMMASGFREIYLQAKNEIILFLENDFCTYCSSEDVDYYLDSSVYFLVNGKADLVRGRSRENPGDPNYAKMNLSQIPPINFIKSKHLSECMYWVDHPDLLYPTKIEKINSEKNLKTWYLTCSSSCNYTNNPYICKKDFFSKSILPYLVDGNNIESMLTPIWARQNYKCIFGFGVFTHDRKDGH